jgi:alpha-galactosidase
MRKKKIAVLGAGSMEFGLASLAGIMRTEGLRGVELALVDIDFEKLELVRKIADRMNREWHADMQISSSLQAKDAMGDADFVLMCVAIDREDAWQKDFETCWKHGITSFAENGGPGGFAHAIRNIGLVLPIMRDVEEYAPNALVLNFTNPLTKLCTAIEKLTRVKTVGICHGIGIGYFILTTAMYKELGIRLHQDPGFKWRDDTIQFFEEYQVIGKEHYEIKAAGINHFTWMIDVYDRHTNDSIYPLVKQRMSELPNHFEPLTQDMFRMFGLIPIQSDTHISEYVPYSSDSRENTWQRYNIQPYDYNWSNKRRISHLEYLSKAANGLESLEPLKNGMSERHEFIMDAMMHNKHSYEEAVNIPNKGYISNLPDDAIVEVPGMVDAGGVSGVHVGALPEPIAELCRRQIVINDLLVEAFSSGSRDMVYQMFAIDPMIQDLHVARNLADDLIDANLTYLPAFR